MADKPTSSLNLGLELNACELKGAQLAYKKGKVVISQLFSIPVDAEHSTDFNVKPLYMNDQERQLLTAAHKSLVVSALPTAMTLVRPLEVHLVRDKDIEAVLEFQAEPLIPYPVDEAVIDYVMVEKAKDGSKLNIIAARAEHISEHILRWQSLSIEPEVVASTPIALTAFAKQYFAQEDPFFGLDLGREETTFILAKHGILFAAQSSGTGCTQLMEAYAKDCGISLKMAQEPFGKLDFSSISEQELPQLFMVLTKLKREVTRYAYAFEKHKQASGVKQVLLTGCGSSLPSLGSFLVEATKKEIAPLQPTELIDSGTLQEYALPIGMALTAIPNATAQVNFRQKEFIYPHPWKRIKKPMAAFFALSLALAASIYFFGEAYIAKREDQLKVEYVQLLVLMKKNYSEVEKDLLGKGAAVAAGDTDDGEALLQLSQEEINERLSHLRQEIRETPDMFPLYPNVPSVSDVLAWLSTHPHIQGHGQPDTQPPRILLESLSYKMVKRPEHNKQRERYQVKIELEFSTPTPRYAREFHDILLAPNDYVDQKNDVKWSAERGKYRATFFLKDRTIYPSSRKS